MKDKDNSFESYMRGDLTNQLGDIKEVLENLTRIVQFGYDDLAEDKAVSMAVLGITGYVQHHIIDEFAVILEMLETV